MNYKTAHEGLTLDQGKATRLCKRVRHVETYRVEVVFTFTEMVFAPLWYFFRCLLYGILCFTILVIISVYPLLHARCYLGPKIELEGVIVHYMTVSTAIPTNTTFGPQIEELSYSVNMTLTMHNPNTIRGCAIKYSQVVVSTAYRGEVLQQSSSPLAFTQKHGETQAVWVPMLDDHIPLNQTNGKFLQQEVSNDNVLLEVYLDTRFRTAERKTKSNRVTCQVIVSTPNSGALGVMLYRQCSVH